MVNESQIKTEEHFEWNVENEIHLFEAMIGFKPVGIHKHFHMACICERLETLLGKPVSPDVIWKHLSNMYDLAALDKKEVTPFPNEVEEFTLPVSDFSELMAEKISKTELANEMVPKEEKPSKTSKESSQGNGVGKKEKKVEQDENNPEGDNKEPEEVESDGKKGKNKKDEKPTGKRGKRSLKDKKIEEDNSQVPTSNVKKGDDDSSSTQTNSKKGKRMIGKRSLRSRADDTSSNKSSTPPPTKRPRRA